MTLFFERFLVKLGHVQKLVELMRCKRGRRHKTGAECAVRKDENCFLFDPTRAQDVCVWDECHCRVYCHRLWCDHCATTWQGFNKHATSRRDSVSDSRGVHRCIETNFQKSTHAHMCRSFDSYSASYSYPEISTIFRRHCTIFQVNSSRTAQYPCQALISICGISRVPVLSFQCHLDSHRSWLTSLKVSEIPNLENLEWIRISCECVSSCDLLLVPLPLRVLCCCLLTRVSGMIFKFLSVWFVRKSTQLTMHQEHTFLILHWTRQQSPVLDIHSSRGIDQRNTVCKMCFSSSLDHQHSQRLNIPWCVPRSCSSHSIFNATIVR